MQFIILDNKTEKLEISILGYERGAVGSYYDDNWLTCQVNLNVFNNYHTYDASFQTKEFASFLMELESFSKKQMDKASFNTIEQTFGLVFSWGMNDSILVKGNGVLPEDYNKEIKFESEILLLELSSLIEQLKSLVKHFPER